MTVQRAPLALVLTVALGGLVSADPNLDAEAARSFARSLGSQLDLEATGSQFREEAYLYPHHRALSARYEGLQVSRVWLASHAHALSFANARRIELTTEQARWSSLTVMEVRGAQVLLARGPRLEETGLLQVVRVAAWGLFDDGKARPALPAFTAEVAYAPSAPEVSLHRVRLTRPADEWLIELPAAGNRVAIPGAVEGEWTVEPAFRVGASEVLWGASRGVRVDPDHPQVMIGPGYELRAQAQTDATAPRHGIADAIGD